MAATGSKSNVVALSPKTPAGGLLKGDAQSVIPVDAVAPLDATFKPTGYVTDKGVSLKPSSSITKKKAWGGSVIKVMTSEKSAEVSLSMAEFLSVDTMRAVFGDENVVVVPATATHGEQTALRVTGELPDVAPYVIEAKDGKRKVRVVIPALQITDQGDFIFDDNATSDKDVKGEAMADEDGVLFSVFTDDGETV